MNHDKAGCCRARNKSPATLLTLACLLLSLPALPATAVAEETLPSGHGYMLIRVEVNHSERISRFAFTQVDTKEETLIHMDAFTAAGATAWMAVVAAPAGRYYWSEYESIYGIAIAQTRDFDHTYRRTAPGSADDTFEIVTGVVNYIGDWMMRVVASERSSRLEPIIGYEKSTLERYVTEYPELVNEYPIFLSMMGKAAISLDEMAKIIESQSE